MVKSIVFASSYPFQMLSFFGKLLSCHGMSQVTPSIFERRINPIFFALFCFGLSLLFMGVGVLMKQLDIFDMGERFAWTCGGAFLFFFGIFNSVFSLSSGNLNKYWGVSMLAFALLAILTAVAATWISGIPIQEAGTFKWIYFVVTIGYLAFLSITGFIKRIFVVIQKENAKK